MIDIAFTNTIEPLKGKLLISDPFLDEDYFRRSIVYLCEYNKEGSFGFVVNNFISISLHDLDENFPEVETQISLGGPMETNSLYFIHTLGDKIQNSVMIEDGLYLGGDFQELSNLITADNSVIKKVRFFIGYSGWGESQLEEELKTNAWIVSETNSTLFLFGSKAKQSWKRYMYELGGKFKIMSKFILHPENN